MFKSDSIIRFPSPAPLLTYEVTPKSFFFIPRLLRIGQAGGAEDTFQAAAGEPAP